MESPFGKKPVLRRLFLPEVLLLGLGGAAFLLWGVVTVTDSTMFCGSACHAMAPYREAWETSHHRKAACVTCHIEDDGTPLSRRAPGLHRLFSYLSHGFSGRTTGGSSDRICLTEGCHDQRLLAGGVTVQGTRVHFDHQPHLAESRHGILLRCTSCHALEVMGMSSSISDRDPCFLCHLPQAQGPSGDLDCVTCHPSPSLSPGPENLHRRAAGPPPACRRCHARITWMREKVDRQRCAACHGGSAAFRSVDVPDEIHRIHVTALQGRCSSCHPGISHRPDERPADRKGGPGSM
jgi:nitrate/TMAO reductase-like tetraheme cytochrome c subunit